MKKIIEKLEFYSLYYREGMIGFIIGFIIGAIILWIQH
jgi:type III secretory pathway component EscT